MAKRWELAALLRDGDLEEIFSGTPWEEEARIVSNGLDAATMNRDSSFLRAEVPEEMVVYGLAVIGSVVYLEGRNVRWRQTENSKAVPLAWVAAHYGGRQAEDLYEKGSINLDKNLK